jgi:malate/lactate dehydrogenase
VLAGEYGLRDVAVSVPARLGPGGVAGVEEWPLDAEELDGLRAAAEVVARATDEIAVEV